MKKCSNCGCELPENAKFCPDCGAPHMPEEEICAAEPETPEKNICEQCGLELPETAKFCTVCGGKAIKGASFVTPTKGIISGASSAAGTGGMMEAVAVEPAEEIPADPAPVSLGETTPLVADIPAPIVRDISEPAPVPDIPEIAEIAEMGDIPEIGEIPEAGAVPETPARTPAPAVSTVSAVTAVTPAPAVNVGRQTESPLLQPVSPVQPMVSQPISASQPMSAVSQPVSASQPISASPIIPPVSAAAAGAVPNPAPVNPANSLNPNVQTGAMPTYNAAVNLGKGGGAANPTNFANPVNTAGSSNTANSGKKKMPIGGKIGIIAGSLVAACAVAAGVFFAVDRAAFLSTVLGKEKYAVMVESKAITDAANKIDTQSLSDGVEAFTSVYSAMAQLGATDDLYGSMTDIEDMSNTSGAVPMMSVTPVGTVDGMDMAAYVKTLNELYLKSYGVNSIKQRMSFEVSIGDPLIEAAGGDSAVFKELEQLINNSEIGCGIITDADAMQATYDIKLDQAYADCRMVMNSDNELYIVLPFVSDKGLVMKFPVPAEQVEENAVLRLDKAELSRVIGEIVQSYLMNYKAAAIEMEKGSVEIATVKAQGREITAEFEGELLEKLFTDVAEIIAKDEYLKSEIVGYCNEIGIEMTAEDYETSIMDAFDVEAEDGDKLIITTIIDKNGNVLAKKFVAVAKEDSEGEEVSIGYAIQDKKAAFEMVFGDEGGFTVNADIMSETDFNLAVTVETDGEQMFFNVNCAGVKSEKYCESDVLVGTFVISVGLPESFEDQLGSEEAFAAINNMTLTLSTRVDGNTQNAFVRLDASQYGSVQANVSMTAENDVVSEYPTDVIDLTPALEQGTLDNAGMEQLKDYLDEVGVAYEGIRNALSGYSIFEELPEFSNPLDYEYDPSYGDYALSPDEILDYIDEDLEELAEYTMLVDTSDTEMLGRIFGLVSDYGDLSEDVKALAEADVDSEGYKEALDAANERYWELYDELWDIEIEIDEQGGGSGEQSLSDMLPTVDPSEFTKMDYSEIEQIMLQYNAVFDAIKQNESALIVDDSLRKLYDDADYARIDVDHDWSYFCESLNRGNLNINLLNSLRSSMKEYTPAVNALVEELEARELV